MPVQTRSSRDSFHRRGTFSAATEIGSDENGVTQHRPVDQVASPQRSSLRRALRESLALSKRAMHRKAPSPRGTSMALASSAAPLSRSGLGQAGLQSRMEQRRHRPRSVIGSPTAAIAATTTIPSSKSLHISSLALRTRRNSLRIATRESLKTVETSHGHLSLPANHPKPISAEPLVRHPAPVKKSKAETPSRMSEEGNRRRQTSLFLNRKGTAVSPAIPQRSSLRRAMRESLCTTTQTGTLDGTGSSHGTVLNSIVEVSLPALDGQNSGGISSLSSSAVTNSDIFQGIDSNVRAPSGASHISFIASTTIVPPPFMPEAATLFTAVRPRKRLAPRSTLLKRPPTFPSLLPTPKSASPASVARHQPPTESTPATNIPGNRKLQSGKDDSQSISTRKGWHKVQKIINETPSGLYLVEWEGRDPRTGANVS